MQLCLETLCEYQILRGYKYFVFLLEIFKALGTYQSNEKYRYYNARELIKEVIQITMTA